MKKKLFISYADADLSKVRIIEDVLKNNSYFEPLIIANRRDPLKALTKKVSEGIEASDFIIPILTKASINQQWINQEIGYSMRTNKTIIPITEKLIMSKLRGFIHKESDLPYNFRRHNNPGQENKNFKKSFLTLLEDLESKYKEEALNTETNLSKLDINNKQKKLETIKVEDLSNNYLKNEEIILSESTITILSHLCRDPSGTLIVNNTLQSFALQTNNISFESINNPRERAKLEDTLNQLIENNFIVERGTSGTVFTVTSEGYKFYDSIK